MAKEMFGLQENSPEDEFTELKQEAQNYRILSKEVTRLTGNGEYATTCESAPERRAGFRERQLFHEFIERFPNKEMLPEFILCKDEKEENDMEKKFFLPRTNEIYSVYSSDWIDSEAFKNPDQFLPGSPNFLGQETANHLVRQNERMNQPLSGISLYDAKPTFSSESELLAENEDGFYKRNYEREEKLGSNEFNLIIKILGDTIHDPEGRKLFKELENNLRDINDEKIEEQRETELQSAQRLKNQLVNLAKEIEHKFGPLPEKIAIYDKEYLDMDLSMSELANDFMRNVGKKKQSPPQELEQVYYYPHEGKAEVISLRKFGLRRQWQEDDTTRREDTARNFIDRRRAVKEALLKFVPDTQLRFELGY